MMYFTDPKGTPVYVYKPISLVEESEITKWEDEMFETYKKKQFHWIKNCYWKLDILSCVLVNRNKKWFADNVETLVNIWNIINLFLMLIVII